VGPGGYLSGGRRRFAHTNAHTYNYANTDDHAECNSHSNADSNSHTAIWHPNAAASHANSETYSCTEVPADAASSSESVIGGREVTSDW
jgi:hypothetical protein